MNPRDDEFPVRTPGRRLLGYLPAIPGEWPARWYALGRAEVLQLEGDTPPAAAPAGATLRPLPTFRLEVAGQLHTAFYADPLVWPVETLRRLPGWRAPKVADFSFSEPKVLADSPMSNPRKAP